MKKTPIIFVVIIIVLIGVYFLYSKSTTIPTENIQNPVTLTDEQRNNILNKLSSSSTKSTLNVVEENKAINTLTPTTTNSKVSDENLKKALEALTPKK